MNNEFKKKTEVGRVFEIIYVFSLFFFTFINSIRYIKLFNPIREITQKTIGNTRNEN